MAGGAELAGYRDAGSTGTDDADIGFEVLVAGELAEVDQHGFESGRARWRPGPQSTPGTGEPPSGQRRCLASAITVR